MRIPGWEEGAIMARKPRKRPQFVNALERKGQLVQQLVDKNSIALSITVAAVGWTLFIWERVRARRLQRRVNELKQDECTGTLQYKDVRSVTNIEACTEHTQAHSDIAQQLQSLKDDVEQGVFDSVALEPCTVDLVQEEEKLMNLQLELEALSAELKPGCPPPTTHRAPAPDWYSFVTRSAGQSSRTLLEQDIDSSSSSSSRSMSRQSSRNIAMAGFQQRLRPLDLGTEEVPSQRSPSPSKLRHPEVGRYLLEQSLPDDHTTTLLLPSSSCRRSLPDVSKHDPARADCMPTPPHSSRRIGPSSPLSSRRRAASACGSKGRAPSARSLRCNSVPGSPWRKASTTDETPHATKPYALPRADGGRTQQSAARLPGRLQLPPSPFMRAADPEGAAARLQPALSCREQRKEVATPWGSCHNGGALSCGSKIPRLPSPWTTAAACSPAPTPGADFKISSFRGSQDAPLQPAAAATPYGASGCRDGDSSEFGKRYFAKSPEVVGLDPGLSASKIPKPASLSVA